MNKRWSVAHPIIGTRFIARGLGINDKGGKIIAVVDDEVDSEARQCANLIAKAPEMAEEINRLQSEKQHLQTCLEQSQETTRILSGQKEALEAENRRLKKECTNLALEIDITTDNLNMAMAVVERMKKYRQAFEKGNYHHPDDAVCSICGGPLHCSRDAVCDICAPGPEIEAIQQENVRLKQLNGELLETCNLAYLHFLANSDSQEVFESETDERLHKELCNAYSNDENTVKLLNKLNDVLMPEGGGDECEREV